MERRRRPEPRRRPRERWLLTRKTWKYMTDAGRRLVPDGARNRAEDVPRIEAYFQDVCAHEPRFLLWRKSSYPGALPRPRRKRRPRSASVRSHEPDDAPPPRPTELHISGGRLDIAKLRRDFFATPTPAGASSSGLTGKSTRGGARETPRSPPHRLREEEPVAAPEEDEDSTLAELLRKYLKLEEDRGPARLTEADELVRSLRRFLRARAETDAASDDNASRSLLDNLGRYYSRSPNRENIVQDILTDRNLLKRLYHDLRKTKPYRGAKAGGSGGASGSYGASGGFGRGMARSRTAGARLDEGDWSLSPPMSPPPLIEVCREESVEEEPCVELVSRGTQTEPLSASELAEAEREWRSRMEAREPQSAPASPPPERPARRRSSVDHDDVSQSVSDTIKRYLRMARKKSVDADKADRFKRINYDKNLRNIKPKLPSDVDDDGLHKGCQTEEGWMLGYREGWHTSPPSPASPTAPASLLASLLGRGGAAAAAPAAGAVHKSRSSSSVVHSVSKRLWKTRSRSSSRVVSTWTPQGSCCWTDGSGRSVRLADTCILQLSEVERKALQQAALARLQQINLGTSIKIPEESSVAVKPKRRAHLLKRKALTTGFFDQSRKDEKDKDAAPGSVFGLPLAQCVESEQALRRQHGGSRASLQSLTHLDKDDSESCDSSDWAVSRVEDGSEYRKVPALVSACLAHLRRNGLTTLGLFRVSASKKRVRQLREEWERCQETALDAAVCPHDVATLLKEFLRDLPDPLLCRDLYQPFLMTQKIRNRRLQWEATRLLITLLPPAHRDTLHALLDFLAQLSTHAGEGAGGNKMDAANLATIFAPTILHCNMNDTASMEQLSERADVINVVRTLIERHAELWRCAGEELHDAYIHLPPQHLHALLVQAANASDSASEQSRLTCSREQLLHRAAVTTTNEPTGGRRRRDGSDTSSGSLSSAMSYVTSRLRSGSGTTEESSARDSAPSTDTEYNETLCGSDSDCVITASLHIPARPPRPASADSGARDVGSSSCSPPASPPLVSLGRERMTSDARAVILRQHDETTTRQRTRIEHIVRTERKDEQSLRKPDQNVRRDDQNVRRDEQNVRRDDQNVRRDDQNVRRDDQNVRRDDPNSKKDDQNARREGVTLYKRGELISSARSPT